MKLDNQTRDTPDPHSRIPDHERVALTLWKRAGQQSTVAEPSALWLWALIGGAFVGFLFGTLVP